MFYWVVAGLVRGYEVEAAVVVVAVVEETVGKVGASTLGSSTFSAFCMKKYSMSFSASNRHKRREFQWINIELGLVE